MLTDRYGLALSTQSEAARDAFVLACDRALTLYPGATAAFDQAIAADPGFALAQAGKAQVLLTRRERRGGAAGSRGREGLVGGVTAREASHIAFFDLVFAGRTEAAISASHAHLSDWPRDALVVASAQSQRPDRSLRPHWAEASDRGDDGQPGAALRRRLLVPRLSCHGAVRGWATRRGASEDRAIGGLEPEQCPRCAWVRACLLRER